MKAYIKNTRGHEWAVDEDGEIDIFAFEIGMHNGPQCVKCGYGFCHHCHELPEEDCGVAPSTGLAAGPISGGEGEGPIPIDTLQDILCLVMDPWPSYAELESWTDGEREAAGKWAAACYMAASDNDVEPVPEPEALRLWRGKPEPVSGGTDRPALSPVDVGTPPAETVAIPREAWDAFTEAVGDEIDCLESDLYNKAPGTIGHDLTRARIDDLRAALTAASGTSARGDARTPEAGQS